jgi:hypothetical protein
MSSAPFPRPQPKPLILTQKDEAILQQIAEYRFLTAQEITRLCYSQGSHTYARARLSALSGNTDYALGYPLYRLPFPSAQGNRERIYTLGSLGREILENLGLNSTWQFKPAKLRTYSHSYLLHDLARNRFVVSLLTWAKTKSNLSIESELSYELAKSPAVVEIPVQGKLVKVSVIPDGLIVVTNTRTTQRLLILLEIDQNTQAESRFISHIASRLVYTKCPQFTNTYKDVPYRIVYATHGITDAAAKARLSSMCKFTMDVLTERNREKEAAHFRFTTINFSTLYEDSHALFEQPVWVRPDAPTTPVPLLTG